MINVIKRTFYETNNRQIKKIVFVHEFDLDKTFILIIIVIFLGVPCAQCYNIVYVLIEKYF